MPVASMEVAATVEFELDRDGSTRISQLRSGPPLVLCETTSGLMMLGAAAGPLGGDRWTLRIGLGAGSQARIGSVAGTVVQRGRQQADSSFAVRVDVAANATLDWTPEPLVVTEGAVHRSLIDIEMASTSRLRWRDIVVLGRHAQPPGRSITRWRVRRAGRPLFAHDVDIGAGAPAGWDGPAVLAGSRVIGSLLVVDPALAVERELPAIKGATMFSLAGPGILVVAHGQTTIEVAAALAAAHPLVAGR
jgi:urease accessory protein